MRQVVSLERLTAAAEWEAKQVEPRLSPVKGGVMARSPDDYPLRFAVIANTQPEALEEFRASLVKLLLIGHHPKTTNPRWWPAEWHGYEDPCPCPYRDCRLPPELHGPGERISTPTPGAETTTAAAPPAAYDYETEGLGGT